MTVRCRWNRCGARKGQKHLGMGIGTEGTRQEDSSGEHRSSDLEPTTGHEGKRWKGGILDTSTFGTRVGRLPERKWPDHPSKLARIGFSFPARDTCVGCTDDITTRAGDTDGSTTRAGGTDGTNTNGTESATAADSGSRKEEDEGMRVLQTVGTREHGVLRSPVRVTPEVLAQSGNDFPLAPGRL